MRLQQSAFSGFGYSPSASTTASGNDTGGPSQATARKVLLGSVWSALGLSGPTGGVQDIASALSSALSTGLASGQDLAPQLTQTIDNALDQVSQRLEAQGVSPGHVAKLVSKFRQDLADAVSAAAASAGNVGAPSTANTGGPATSTSGATGVSTIPAVSTSTTPAVSTSANTGTATSANAGTSANTATGASVATSATAGAGNPVVSSLAEFASIRESETLTIQTTDGAQVTLRFRARASEFGVSQTQADGSTTSAAALFASGKFQVEVSGNLSSADMTAINNIVSQVNSLATEFFSGDVQDAFAAAANIGADPSEIAGFSLQMSYSATVYQQASATTTPADTSGAATTSSPTGTTPAANANGTPAPTATAGNTPASAGGASTTPSATSATPQQVIANFLQNALAKLSVASNGSSASLSGRWGIQLLAVALPTYAQSQTAAGSGNNTPAVTQVATQAAHLAAATLIQLVN